MNKWGVIIITHFRNSLLLFFWLPVAFAADWVPLVNTGFVGTYYINSSSIFSLDDKKKFPHVLYGVELHHIGLGGRTSEYETIIFMKKDCNKDKGEVLIRNSSGVERVGFFNRIDLNQYSQAVIAVCGVMAKLFDGQ